MIRELKLSGNPPTQTNSLLYKYLINIREGHSTMKHSEGFLKLVNDAKSRIREVSVDETRERMKANDAARLIDVREDNE